MKKNKKILLFGNPNVGKSIFFSRLTGIRVIASNYPGTTVSYSKGYLRFKGEIYEIIDVPGVYSLEPVSEAEKVAKSFLSEGDYIVNIIDGTNLERNLYLSLQLIEKGKPMVIALNFADEMKHRGIEVDVKSLENLLGVPVIPTIALTGEGIKEVLERLLAQQKREKVVIRNKWSRIGKIIKKVQKITHRHHSFVDLLEDISFHPFWGFIFAFIVVMASFFIIRFIGESIISFLTEPFFEYGVKPILAKVSSLLLPFKVIHTILIGELINGEIDFTQSFGMLTTGIYVPIGMVLPYIFSFYLILSVLEDIGYLPRLAVFLDRWMHKIGLHGYAIIPTILGLGCNVPGILATRILESKVQRFITATLISIAIPCSALQAMIIGFVGSYGIKYVVLVYTTLFFVWVLLSIVLRITAEGFRPELLIEIPPYRFPGINAILKKVWLRVRSFVVEAIPIVLAGVFVVNFLYSLKVFDFLANVTSPVIKLLWGLPKNAIVPVLLGFLRKDIAVGLLASLDLTPSQAVVATVVLSTVFPCIATFIVLLKELGIKDFFKSLGIMIIITIFVGWILNIIL